MYSDEDPLEAEERADQPEEWWDSEEYYAWEQRKRKRAKQRGELESDTEEEKKQKKKKQKCEGNLAAGGSLSDKASASPTAGGDDYMSE